MRAGFPVIAGSSQRGRARAGDEVLVAAAASGSQGFIRRAASSHCSKPDHVRDDAPPSMTCSAPVMKPAASTTRAEERHERGQVLRSCRCDGRGSRRASGARRSGPRRRPRACRLRARGSGRWRSVSTATGGDHIGRDTRRDRPRARPTARVRRPPARRALERCRRGKRFDDARGRGEVDDPPPTTLLRHRAQTGAGELDRGAEDQVIRRQPVRVGELARTPTGPWPAGIDDEDVDRCAERLGDRPSARQPCPVRLDGEVSLVVQPAAPSSCLRAPAGRRTGTGDRTPAPRRARSASTATAHCRSRAYPRSRGHDGPGRRQASACQPASALAVAVAVAVAVGAVDGAVDCSAWVIRRLPRRGRHRRIVRRQRVDRRGQRGPRARSPRRPGRARRIGACMTADPGDRRPRTSCAAPASRTDSTAQLGVERDRSRPGVRSVSGAIPQRSSARSGHGARLDARAAACRPRCSAAQVAARWRRRGPEPRGQVSLST